MRSLRSIQASRANGALSRGPVTTEGKRRSAMNALRHGMLAQTVVLEGESVERFKDLLQALEAEHLPATPTESSFVETMAVARWLQMRAWGFAKAEFDLEMARQDPALGQRPLRAANAFRNIVDNGGAFDKSQRYAVTFERQFTRALRNLKQIQLSRPREVPLPNVPGSLANSTWDSDPENLILRNEPDPKTGHIP